jgi:uncharacterized protein YjiS (DUF1127 family)
MPTASATFGARHRTTPRAALSTSFGRILRHLVEVIAAEYRIRRDMRHLMTFNDDMLRDIGLSRAQVARAVRSGRIE